MLLGQLDCEFIGDILCVTLKSGIESALTINNDESEWRLADQKLLLQIFEVELGVTRVDGEIDGFEGFEITNEFFLSGGSFVHNLSTEENESVIGSTLIQFESFPG